MEQSYLTKIGIWLSFIIFLKDAIPDFLEGFTTTEPYPSLVHVNGYVTLLLFFFILAYAVRSTLVKS